MDDERLMRDSRHIMLPEIDREGQRRFNDARVLLVGAGGFGRFDARSMVWTRLRVLRDPGGAVCGAGRRDSGAENKRIGGGDGADAGR